MIAYSKESLTITIVTGDDPADYRRRSMASLIQVLKMLPEGMQQEDVFYLLDLLQEMVEVRA